MCVFDSEIMMPTKPPEAPAGTDANSKAQKEDQVLQGPLWLSVAEVGSSAQFGSEATLYNRLQQIGICIWDDLG